MQIFCKKKHSVKWLLLRMIRWMTHKAYNEREREFEICILNSDGNTICVYKRVKDKFNVALQKILKCFRSVDIQSDEESKKKWLKYTLDKVRKVLENNCGVCVSCSVFLVILMIEKDTSTVAVSRKKNDT